MTNTILIIGANSDVAYELILSLAEKLQPQLFLLASKNTDALKQVANDIQLRTRIATQTLALDVENLSLCETFYEKLSNKPDLVIYCAGYLGDQAKAEVDTKEAQKILAVNYTGAMVLLEQVATDMAQKKQGTIVGISSVAGLRGRKKNYHYGAAKAAFTTYLSGLRNRLFSANVHVITVLPGFIDTKMTQHLNLPKALTASPKEVAQAIVHAITRKKDVIYVKKIWQLVMGIIEHIPEMIFKKMDI